MPTVPETIRRLRDQIGLSPKEMAERIWMNVASYYDLESDPEEREEAVELS
jgi:ribosome-binding protein aMBF1 (putative translation factor)